MTKVQMSKMAKFSEIKDFNMFLVQLKQYRVKYNARCYGRAIDNRCPYWIGRTVLYQYKTFFCIPASCFYLSNVVLQSWHWFLYKKIALTMQVLGLVIFSWREKVLV